MRMLNAYPENSCTLSARECQMMSQSFKAPIAFTAEAGFMAIGTAMGLIPGWIVFAFIIFAIATLVVGTRM